MRCEKFTESTGKPYQFEFWLPQAGRGSHFLRRRRFALKRVFRAFRCHFVFAGSAAAFAVHQTVGAETHVELGLAVHAEFVARAVRFGPLTLGAVNGLGARFGGHSRSLILFRERKHVTEVTEVQFSAPAHRAPRKCGFTFSRKFMISSFPENWEPARNLPRFPPGC